MNLLDAVFSLAIGLLLVAQPQVFFKSHGSELQVTRRRAYLRQLGYVLLAASLLLALAATRHL
jgi:hypothetical protein